MLFPIAWLRVWAVNKEGHREDERWSSWNTDVCEYRTKLVNDRLAVERAFKSLSKRNSKGFSQSPYPIFQRHHSMCALICTHVHAYLYTRTCLSVHMCMLNCKHVHAYLYTHACVLSCFSPVPLFATPWTVTHHAPLPMEFSRQEYWSGLPCPYPENLPDLGIEAVSPALKALLYCWAMEEVLVCIHIQITDCTYICINIFIAIIYLYLILVDHKTPVEIGGIEISKYVYVYFPYIDVVV